MSLMEPNPAKEGAFYLWSLTSLMKPNPVASGAFKFASAVLQQFGFLIVFDFTGFTLTVTYRVHIL